MLREVIVPTNEQHWLSLRLQDITSTQSPALFNLSPYMTKFELYHAKASGLDMQFEENERMTWGKRLEPVIAAGIAEDRGYKLRKITEYVRLPEFKMGSSFDYEITCPKRGKGILEIKNVDQFVFKDNWVDSQAPEHIEIQLQHQLEVKGDCNFGIIAAFIGGNRLELLDRDRDTKMGTGIRMAIERLWADVAAKREPDPDFDRDGDVIKKLYNGKTEMSDKTRDLDFQGIINSYTDISAQRKRLEKQEKNLSAQIIRSLGSSIGAYTDRHRIKASPVVASQGTLVTPEMVGTYVGSRGAYHRIYVKDLGSTDGSKSKRSKT